MGRMFDAAEVAKHNTPESCWIVLYGKVYDVTKLLPEHPGGAIVILKLAGRDATEEYDPVHPPGTLEENLPPDATLGSIDPATVLKNEASNHDKLALDGSPPLDSLLNLDEIEEVATKQISKTAWAYYFSASDDLASKSLNSTAYRSILLRPRIFVDCEKCDTSTTILGHRVSAPIYVSPAAMARLAHPAGEGGIATACASYGAMQIISNNASMTPEQIVATAPASQVFGWQLYVQTDTAKSEAMLARVNALAPRIKFITLTLDAPVPGKREHDQRGSKMGGSLPVASAVAAAPGKLTVAGIGGALFFGTSSKLTWKATLPWLAKNTSLPIVLKGIQTHEDAYLAACYAPQVQGIILSNHGGRALDTAPPPIHTLLEIRKHCPEVLEKIEVYVDGGIKRGTDIAKALCLGARAVGIGRAALWGLGAGGQAGVERTFQILQDELKTAMRLLGAGTVAELKPAHVNTRALDKQIFDGPAGLEKFGLWGSSKL